MGLTSRKACIQLQRLMIWWNFAFSEWNRHHYIHLRASIRSKGEVWLLCCADHLDCLSIRNMSLPRCNQFINLSCFILWRLQKPSDCFKNGTGCWYLSSINYLVGVGGGREWKRDLQCWLGGQNFAPLSAVHTNSCRPLTPSRACLFGTIWEIA